MYLVTSEQMQRFDKHTITSLRVPGIILMEHAGKEVARIVMARSPHRVVVLCGKGNNGGDGWIAARWLHDWGVPEVTVLSLAEPVSDDTDAGKAADMALAAGVTYQVYDGEIELPEADVYVDALFGTGISRALSGHVAQLVEQVNAKSRWTVAVDVPSGIDASTGEVHGIAIRAEETVAMALQKLGTAITPGALYAGKVMVADIGIRVTETYALAEFTDAHRLYEQLPGRNAAVHKGTFGRVGIAVGTMQGAAILAGLGAMRSGAGLVALAKVDVSSERGMPPEFIVRNVSQDAPVSVFGDCSAVVFGPGLGTLAGEWQSVFDAVPAAAVLDADALSYAFGVRKEGRVRDMVLTPHPKECARLLGWSTDEVQAKRLAAARTLAETTQCTVVLKGFRSIIAHPDGRIRINPTGDASLATAGTGDVLAGMIGAFLAQGLSPFDAASLAAFLHGTAGELAGQTMSPISVMASDVVDFISRAIRLHFDMNPGG